MANFFDAFGKGKRTDATSADRSRRSSGSSQQKRTSSRYDRDDRRERYDSRDRRYDDRYDDRYADRRGSYDRYDGYGSSRGGYDRYDDMARRDSYERQDELLGRINEFRNRAGQLQELVAERTREADKLEDQIERGEGELQMIIDDIDDKKEEAEKLQGDIDTKLTRIDGMMEQKIDEKFDESFTFKFDSNFSEAMDSRFNEIKQTLSEALSDQSDVESIKQEIKNTLRESSAETFEEIKTSQEETLGMLNERIEALKEATDRLDSIEKGVKALDTKIEEKLGGDDKDIAAKIIEAKDDLSEKIHTEDVKCFRNMQVLIEEQNTMFESVEVGAKTKKFIKGRSVILAILSLINTGGLVFLILYSMKIIRF